MFEFESRETRHAVLTMLGGVLWSVVLGLDDVAPEYVGLAVVAPVLIGFGVLETYARYGERYGSTGRAGVVLSALGLAFLLVSVLLYAVSPPGLLVVVLAGVPGVTGVAALAIGSGLLALALYRLGVVSPLAAALVGLGVPLTVPAGALLAALTPGGAFAGVPPGAVTGLGGAPYGVGWLLVGYRFWKTAGEDHAEGVDQRSVSVDETPNPHLVVASVVGGVFVLLSAGRFVPLGPLSGTPWVNQSVVLDVGHLLAGVTGLLVAAWRNVRVARAYNRVVGGLSLAVVAVTFLATFQDVHWLQGFAVDVLDLNLPDALLHLPAGVITGTVGFGIGVETDGVVSSRRASSE